MIGAILLGFLPGVHERPSKYLGDQITRWSPLLGNGYNI